MATVGELPGYRVVTEPVEIGPCAVAHARRESDDTEVTVHVVVEPLDRSAVRRFRTEAAVLSSVLGELNSPLIVPLVDHGQDRDARPFFVTDSTGTPLTDEAARRGPLPADEVRQIVLGTAPGLVALHRKEVLHLGLSPAALLRQPSGRVLLGTPLLPVLAEIDSSGSEGSGHEPPEVLNGGDWTPRAELYAFASTVWTLLAGRPPVTGTRYERLLHLLNETSPRPSTAGLPPRLADLLLRALARDPGDRPQSLASFADALQEELSRVGDPDRTAPAAQPGALTRSEQAMGTDYALLSVLGSGSAGHVWRARRISDGREVAVKVLNPESATDATSRTRLVREHATLCGLTHPHLVKVLDIVIDRGRAAIVMDFVPGQDLRELLDAGKIDRAEGVRLLAEVASGLAHLHAQRIVHRDVKPANILVRATGDRRTALLTDFGLVKVLGDADLTRVGQVLGTPAYLAPELVHSAEPTLEADVYALGVTVYEVLAGRRLFTGTSDEVLHRHRHERPTRPSGLSDDAWRFLAACLAKAPRERPTAAEASEVLHDLVRDLALTPPEPFASSGGGTPGGDVLAPAPLIGTPHFGPLVEASSVATMTSARPPSPEPPVEPPAPRFERRTLLVALAAVVLAGSVTGGLLAWSSIPDDPVGEAPPTTSTPTGPPSGQAGSLVYRLPVTLGPAPDGGTTITWSTDAAELPGLDRFVVMQGGVLRAEVPSSTTTYLDPAPLSTGCYFVVALGVTEPAPDPAPKSACPN
ncbi:protein kinase domain-containing protein [Saccharothrix sp. Mg75]|uniref:protein kinase domain-containing protein n=1 Tax=Saccharothrix sp. Mg75 TaxID=3445357 RepID=UPI003EE9148C